MPGIHVRTFSQLDWLEQEKGSLLTIPGSYWLCHKKNIYKFIFRYHRTVKNAIQFSYGRELLKVIRRIIKCHPTQGQQFGTQHLLVTYNCTSWTRQDKMFAILKFQQRTDAAAFSHAFVLTIRICSSSEQSLFNSKYSIAKETDAGNTFKDLNESVNTEEGLIKTMVDTTDKISSEKSITYQDQREASKHDVIKDTSNETLKTPVNANLQIDIEKSANTHESLDAGAKNTVTCTVNEEHLIDKCNVEFYDDVVADKSINLYAERFEIDMKRHSIDHRQEQSLQIIKKDEIKIKKSDGKNQQIKRAKEQEQYQEMQDIRQYNAFSSSKTLVDTTKSGAGVDKSSNGYSLDENSIEEHVYAVDNEDSLNHKKKTGESIVDSSNIPYQYFIEKEIENSKYSRKAETFSPIIGKVIEKGLLQQDKHETEFVNEDSIPKVIKNSNDGATQNENCNKMTDFPSQENDKQNIPILVKTDDNRAQNNAPKSYKNRKQKSRDPEKKTIADDKVLRSSNITDLVMEGLMFTIRQDRDSVAVIEQKTKLEMDEVLENSEKVETKAGEKCLLNSSLLRLENLITMIDSPRDKHERYKSGYAIGSNVYSSPFNALADNAVYKLDDINYIDREMNKATISSCDKHSTTDQLNSSESLWNQCAYSSIINNDDYLTSGNTINKREQFMECEGDGSERDRGHVHKDDTAMEEEKEQDEEDIIPEFFQPTTFSLERTIPKKQFAGSENRDLLMDDMEMEKAAKCNVPIEEYDSFSSLCPSSSSSKMTMKEVSTISESRPIKRQSNVPRVVSNKSITVEQMPLALQKVLRTCRKRGFPSTNNAEILPVHQRKIQCTKNAIFTESIIFEANESEKQYINSDVANKSLSIKISNDIGEMKSNKADTYAVNNKKTPEEDSNKHVKNIKKRDNETCGISQTSSLLEHSLPRKLQDITEDFYYDLQAHNKDNAIRQRCLRKRRKSLNNSDDIKNSKMRIEMLKFIQDMTEGAKVVVKRLNIANKSNLLEKNIASTTCKH